MSRATFETLHSAAGACSAAMFTPLERTVLALARDERGRGLLPMTGFGQVFARLSSRLFGQPGVRPLADPRLEALRSFVNALHKCSRVRIDGTAEALRLAGFGPLQEAWIRATFARCA